MWHVVKAEVFSADNHNQPVAVIRREAGGMFAVDVEPGRVLPSSSVQSSEDGLFASFDDALAFASGD